MPTTNTEDILAYESDKWKDKIQDEYGRDHSTDKTYTLETDWACAEEKCKWEHEDSFNMDPRRKT